MPALTNAAVKVLGRVLNSNNYEIVKRRKTDIRPIFGGGLIRETRLIPENANVANTDVYYTMYKNEAPIRGAINVIVNAVTSTGYDFKTLEEGDPEKKDPRILNLIKWWENPEHQSYSAVRQLTENLLIHDNSFGEITANEVTEGNVSNQGWIYPLDTRDCTLKPGKDNKTMGNLIHKVKTGGQKSDATTLKPEHYIHLAMHKSGSSLGLSPLESLVKTADLRSSSVTYNQSLFDANGVPTMAFILEEGNEDDYLILKKATTNIKQGQSFCAKGKIKVEVLGGRQNEIGYKDLVEQVYQDIMTVYSIPPTLMSKPGPSTMESSREETSSFSMNIQAIQMMVNNAINRSIVKIWGEDYIDIQFVLKPWVNDKAQAAIDKIYLADGVFTPNDVRRRMGLEPVWWGNVPYNMNGPLGLGLEPWAPAPDAPEGWPEPPAEPTQDGSPGGTPNEAEGQPGSVERPERQGSTTERDKILLELMEYNKTLIAIIKNRELASDHIRRQLERDDT